MASEGDHGSGSPDHACGFAAAVAGVLADVSYETAMAVSGGAWRFFFDPAFSPRGNELLAAGGEPVRRTFDALGYAYELLVRRGAAGGDAAFDRAVSERLSAGRPVLLRNPLTPSGYAIGGEDGGGADVRDATSPGATVPAPDLLARTSAAIVVGPRAGPWSPARETRAALEWAVELVRGAWRGGRLSGLAALEAFADELERDRAFPAADPDLARARAAAARGWLVELADSGRAAAAWLGSRREAARDAGSLRSAAELYGRIAERAGAPGPALALEDGDDRREIAACVRELSDLEARAVLFLERALRHAPEGEPE